MNELDRATREGGDVVTGVRNADAEALRLEEVVRMDEARMRESTTGAADTTSIPDRAAGSSRSTHRHAGEVLISSAGLAKNFGPTQALVDCSLELRRGEVHALLGENGSGKSTFAKLITGIHRPTRGVILAADGTPISFRGPAEARAHGVVAVYQDILVAPQLSVLDNIWLGSDGIVRTRTTKQNKQSRGAEMMQRLLGREVDLDRPVSALSLSDQQAVCIARALVQPFDVLVLDEATSSLDLQSRSRLFDILRELAAAGKATLFVSHRMDEINEIATRLTVMRSGRTLASMDAGTASEEQLLTLLTGQEQAELHRAPSSVGRGAVTIAVRALRLGAEAAPIDAVDLNAGDITALAGLEGHGQDAFLKALWGGETGRGAVSVVHSDGSRHPVTSPHAARKLGIGYVPRDRREESTFGRLSIRANFELPTLTADTSFGIIRPQRTKERFLRFAQMLNLRYGRMTDPLSSLSGGNQQKVVLARWLAMSPRFLLLNDPTRGVDLGTKREIYAQLRQLRDQGVTVVLLSSEIDEILEVADRVLVFRNQTLAGDLPGDAPITRDAIVAHYFGLRAAP